MELTVIAYQDATGVQPFNEWFTGLDKHAAAKIEIVMRRMADGNLADSKSVGDGVVERRIHWGPGYRIYFGRDGAHIVVLLGGGTKLCQQRAIDDAKARWANYKQRRQ
jgi:putative addiction module killer protein